MVFSSILKKALMALTGLALVGFLVMHLAGNLFLFAGKEKFNTYALLMETNPLVIPAEIGLICIFVLHLFLAARLTKENMAARPAVKTENMGQSTFASRTMLISGFVILAFIILHVCMFKFGTNHDANGGIMMWELVVGTFQEPLIAGGYVLAMLLLGMHLSHGIASAFQSLGLRNSNGHPRLRGLGPILGWGIALGFASMPVWALCLKCKTCGTPPAVKSAVESVTTNSVKK